MHLLRRREARCEGKQDHRDDAAKAARTQGESVRRNHSDEHMIAFEF
jgi:hypothetical protein